MPAPRPIATVAKHVLSGVLVELEATRTDITDIGYFIRHNNPDQAYEAEKRVMGTIYATTKIISLLLSDNIEGAEVALNEHRANKEKK